MGSKICITLKQGNRNFDYSWVTAEIGKKVVEREKVVSTVDFDNFREWVHRKYRREFCYITKK